MRHFLTLILSLAIFSHLFAGGITEIQRNLNWSDTPVTYTLDDGTPIQDIWQFEGAVYKDDAPSLPYFFHRFPVSGPGNIQVEIIDAVFEPFDKEPSEDDKALANRLFFETDVSRDRRSYFGHLSFIPIRKNGASYERLTTFKLRITHIDGVASNPATRNGEFTFTSILSDGQIYKLGISTTGVHKLDYNYLVNELGIDAAGLDPRKIQMFGNGGGVLPQLVGAERYDDLTENPIFISGETDGSFDPGDYILFYAEGANVWTYDEESQAFNFQMNVYDTQNYYFLKIGNDNGLRIADRNSISGTYSSSSFNDYARFEIETYNLLDEYELAQGSGQMWFGDYYKNQRSYSYNDRFVFPNIITNEPVKLKAQFAVRANTSSSTFKVTAAGQTMTSPTFEAVDLNNPNGSFAVSKVLEATFNASGSNIPVTVEYPNLGGTTTEGWLDYIQMNARRDLRMEGDQMSFRDIQTLDFPSSNFTLSNAGSNIEIWDISNPEVPVRQQVNSSGNNLSFGVETTTLRHFIAFNKNSDFLSPVSAQSIDNQNIHGLDDVEMVILYHADFEEQAERLAEHRRTFSGLDVATVRIDQLFNEFSSGRMDVTAIRDFSKMLYGRTARYQFLLLFGDGSFDHKGILGLGNNFIPTYESFQSLNPITSFPSDDYFGLLDDEEGNIFSNDFMDISVGRLPAQNPEQAKNIVDKLINYDESPSALGDWRNRVVFIGDDEDSGRHTIDADGIADLVGDKYPFLNVDKIFLDGYNQVPTPAGERVPGATEALNQNMFRGALAVTYLGHGGSKGWAQERVLQLPDIVGWTNFNQLPVFITATCSFAGYDDPGFTTAGEEVLLNPRGGSVAMLTTVRAVYASLNEALTRNVADTLFSKVNGQPQTFGEVLRISKNETGGGSNSRKFTLLGDPSQRLALPLYSIVTTSIDATPASGTPDTLRALQEVTIAGQIQDNQGNLLSSFGGTLFPIIFDKKVEYTTLGQDNSPIIDYDLQKNVLFKGRASVIDGKFEFTFVVPKDINFAYGFGKISYYAENGVSLDAGGAYQNVVIGGTDPNAVADDQGPLVEVFMNSEDFVFGGITSPDPTLLVKLEDDNGINVVGNSIGHDLTGLLDEDTKNTYLLNDFYEAALDDHTRGEVRFPLSALAEGRHSIKVKAWDVANNPAEGYTEFVVAGSGKIALEHVLNYPNPFTTNTCFQFEHNMENQEIDVMVQIYTVSGRLVKTIQERIIPQGSRLSLGDCISWDGRDDFGDQLAKGVYLYRVQVRAAGIGLESLEGESDFEKLVILR